MNSHSRRVFLASAASGVAATMASRRARAAGSAERIRVGVIGGGNQAKQHLRSLSQLKDVEIVYVCDIDARRLAECESLAKGAKGVPDMRRIFEDGTVDAVTIATPDHWHTPAALLAMEAGKHVYVEKPCSHNIREGQFLAEAAKRHGRVVAHGTQSRSNLGFQEAIKMLRGGAIGDVLIAKCWNWQRRKDIGHAAPSNPPQGVDYDAWVGPAEWLPFQANRFHYDWHWWFNFGCGDMGNDGIHEVDYALWGLGVDTHPATVSAVGGKYYFDDDQQFPDTQQVTMEWPGDGKPGSQRMLIFEQRLWSQSYPFNVDSGAEYFGTKGRMLLSKRGKFDVWGDDNKRLDVALQHNPKADVVDNQRNWIDCIKSGKAPHASIDVGRRTADVVHLGNLATRLGRTLHFDAKTGAFVDDAEADGFLSRTYRADGHWGVPAKASS